MADAPNPDLLERPAAPAPSSAAKPEDEHDPELSLGDYFGGYAIIFLGVVGLALLFVLITKLMR
jgi:hypothetical protein